MQVNFNPKTMMPGARHPGLGGINVTKASEPPERIDRKTTPTLKKACFDERSMAAWKKSKKYIDHTFIGITHLSSSRFFLYPAFSQGEDGLYYSLAPKHGYTGETLRKIYGDHLVLIHFGEGGDGIAHQTACARAGVREHDVIGWAIVGSRHKKTNSREIRFASGRNLDRFTNRTGDNKHNTEGRDLPRAWAVWVTEVLRKYLGLEVHMGGAPAIYHKKGKHKKIVFDRRTKEEYTSKVLYYKF